MWHLSFAPSGYFVLIFFPAADIIDFPFPVFILSTRLDIFNHESLVLAHCIPLILAFRNCTIIEAIHTAVFVNKHHIKTIQAHMKAQQVSLE